MRRRLLISTLVVAVTAVLLLGVPLAVVMSRLVNDESARQLQRDSTLAATELQYRASKNQQEDYGEIAQSLSGDYVIIARNGRTVATFGTAPPEHRVRLGQDTDGAYTVTVETNSSGVVGRVAGALGLVAGLALLAIGGAVGLAMLQAQRLIRPLEDLAGAAARLGSGDARPLGRRYGLPELDQVAEGLDGSARRVSDMLTAEREFASDASHQLRTPLTALSMRLEEMIAAADEPEAVRAEGEAALTQTERLAEVVSQLLGRTRRSGGNAPRFTGIDDILSQQIDEWEPAFRRANRKLELTGEKGLNGYVTPGALAQVIATLLDNALVHGAGTVTIRTLQTPRSVMIEVRDEGKGVPDELVPRIFERNFSSRPQGTGLGLALARTVAASDGWRVVLVRPQPAVFAVFLPSRSPIGSEDEPVVSGPA
ncbi:MAG TPA: HAMP domain-containing sensor histidine kinase [Streptosporangiaceae bacterium]